MKKLSEFWDIEVDKEAKHFVNLMEAEKISFIKKQCENFIFNKLDFSKIKTCLDWGCGGGLFTKELKKWSNVSIVDISKESIEEAKIFAGGVAHSQILTENPSDFKYDGPNVDLIFCHAVIHHFPSFDYYKTILNIWKSISPQIISIQVKLGDSTKNNTDYFSGSNYLNGLFIEYDDVINSFEEIGYICTNSSKSQNRYKSALFGYFIFEKKIENIKSYNKGNMGNDIIINYKENLILGRGSTFNDRCWLNARFGITIGENSLFGPNVLIHSTNHVIKHFEIEQNANDERSWCNKNRNERVVGEEVKIGNDVWVGANCIILAGAIIPDKCIIGAGTTITKSNSSILKEGDIVVNNVNLKILGNRKDEKYK